MTDHAPATRATLPPGLRVLGDYIVERPVIRGPLWVTYVGWHAARERERYQVRVLRTAVSARLGVIEAFARQAHLLERLSHRGIVPVTVSGVDQGVPLIVTPDVPGVTLEEKLRRAPRGLETGEVARIVAEIAAVLDYLHEQRPPVVHRELTPAKVLVADEGGVVKVLEVGHAHALRIAGVDVDAADVRPAASYRAPEDANAAGQVGPGIDQFVLASIAYEALTGARAFPGEGEQALAAIRAPARPRACVLRSDLHAEVDAVLAQAWAREPAQRFASAGAFAQQLARALTSGHEYDPLESAGGFTDVPTRVGASAAASLAAQGGDVAAAVPQSEAEVATDVAIDRLFEGLVSPAANAKDGAKDGANGGAGEGPARVSAPKAEERAAAKAAGPVVKVAPVAVVPAPVLEVGGARGRNEGVKEGDAMSGKEPPQARNESVAKESPKETAREAKPAAPSGRLGGEPIFGGFSSRAGADPLAVTRPVLPAISPRDRGASAGPTASLKVNPPAEPKPGAGAAPNAGPSKVEGGKEAGGASVVVPPPRAEDPSARPAVRLPRPTPTLVEPDAKKSAVPRPASSTGLPLANGTSASSVARPSSTSSATSRSAPAIATGAPNAAQPANTTATASYASVAASSAPTERPVAPSSSRADESPPQPPPLAFRPSRTATLVGVPPAAGPTLPQSAPAVSPAAAMTTPALATSSSNAVTLAPPPGEPSATPRANDAAMFPPPVAQVLDEDDVWGADLSVETIELPPTPPPAPASPPVVPAVIHPVVPRQSMVPDPGAPVFASASNPLLPAPPMPAATPPAPAPHAPAPPAPSPTLAPSPAPVARATPAPGAAATYEPVDDGTPSSTRRARRERSVAVRVARVLGACLVLAAVIDVGGKYALHRFAPAAFTDAPASQDAPPPTPMASAVPLAHEAPPAPIVAPPPTPPTALAVAPDAIAPSAPPPAPAADAAVAAATAPAAADAALVAAPVADAALALVAAPDAAAPEPASPPSPVAEAPRASSAPVSRVRLPLRPSLQAMLHVRAAIEDRLRQCEARFGHAGRHARVAVVYDGATGAAHHVHTAGTYFSGRAIGPCIEQAVRDEPMPPFRDDHWSTDYSFMIH